MTQLKEKYKLRKGEKLAKDIDCCEACPLWDNGCLGGHLTGTGKFIDPPCMSWDEDDVIYEGMYLERCKSSRVTPVQIINTESQIGPLKYPSYIDVEMSDGHIVRYHFRKMMTKED